MLRKMVFGPRGRLSTDLDFTCRTDIKQDELMLEMLDMLAEPFHGVSFSFDRERDWYLTDEGCAANPVCRHADNERGVKIKLQVSTRETPILPIGNLAQVKQDYFRLLPFTPAEIPSLDFAEVVAEKIRAASQRAKIRDLYDLSECAKRPLEHEMVRGLAVLKLWHSKGPGLCFERLAKRIADTDGYDVDDLRSLLRKDAKPDLVKMIADVSNGFGFLAHLTCEEEILTADKLGRHREVAARLANLLLSRRTGKPSSGGDSDGYSDGANSVKLPRAKNILPPPENDGRRL